VHDHQDLRRYITIIAANNAVHHRLPLNIAASTPASQLTPAIIQGRQQTTQFITGVVEHHSK
jgi:hypothetical protein